jgi:ribosomal protein L11 methylase PrmA
VTWVNARIIADAQQAEALGDALMEAGALSVTVEDADAGTPAETPQYGEPGMETHTVWARSVLSALFDAAEPVQDIVADCAAALGIDAELCIDAVPETDWVRATQAQFEPIPSAALWIVPSWHTHRHQRRGHQPGARPGLRYGQPPDHAHVLNGRGAIRLYSIRLWLGILPLPLPSSVPAKSLVGYRLVRSAR